MVVFLENKEEGEESMQTVKSKNWHNEIVVIFSCALVLSACGTIGTRSAGPDIPGLTYYLPSSRVTVELFQNQATDPKLAEYYPRFYITVGEPKHYADPSSGRYVLAYVPSIWSDEHLCVGRSQDGLLNTVQFSTANRAGDIVVRAAETAAFFALGGVPGPSMELMKLEKGKPKKTDNEKIASIEENMIVLTAIKPDTTKGFRSVYTSMFDPSINGERTQVEQDLDILLQRELGASLKRADVKGDIAAIAKGFGASFSSELALPAKASPQEPPATEHEKASEQKRASVDKQQCTTTNRNRVCYRTVRPIQVKMSAGRAWGKDNFGLPVRDRPLGAITVSLVDKNNTDFVEIGRALLIRKITRLDFMSGVLTGMSINTPSQALATIELPLRVARAIIEVPASFFTAIARSFNAQTGSAGAEANLINALAKLKQAERSPDAKTQITVNTPEGKAPPIGVELSAPAPYKPLSDLAAQLVCWGGTAAPSDSR